MFSFLYAVRLAALMKPMDLSDRWPLPDSPDLRDELAAAYAEAEAAFPDEVPVPDEWGGYRVRPEVVEFWQGRPGRMHDRLVYRRTAPDLEAWRTERLAP